MITFIKSRGKDEYDRSFEGNQKCFLVFRCARDHFILKRNFNRI